MKAISLSAPYGTLVALAERFPEWGKRFETRGRRTTYRGPLAIHQAKSLGYIGGRAGLIRLLSEGRFFSALARLYPSVINAAGFVKYLPMGKIVAVCDLVGCYPIHPFGIGPMDDGNLGPLPSEPEHSFGDYTPGRFAWFLTNVRALPEPVSARGMPGLWRLSATELAQVEQQIGVLQ